MGDSVETYVAMIMARLRASPRAQSATTNDAENICSAIFSILTSREFCYLGRTRTEPYRERVVDEMTVDIRNTAPVRFYYDLGAGYHASIEPERKVRVDRAVVDQVTQAVEARVAQGRVG